jgi:hypothetical protein
LLFVAGGCFVLHAGQVQNACDGPLESLLAVFLFQREE